MTEDNPIDKEYPYAGEDHLVWCQRIIEANPEQVQAHRNGKDMLGFLVGQVMKACRGTCDPKDVNMTLARLLEEKDAGHQTIYFYSSRAEHGYMSNFARYPVKMDGKTYKTSEHYYQSQKFAGTSWESKVRKVEGPMEAATLGRSKDGPFRKDWDGIKDNVMRKVVEAKFRQHSELARQLLETGDAKLVERTTTDLYWGCGDSGTGKNMLGVILMEVREKLRKEQEIRSAAQWEVVDIRSRDKDGNLIL